MAFQNLREGSEVFLLHNKSGVPYVEAGVVVGQVKSRYEQRGYEPGVSAMRLVPRMVLDVQVQVGEMVNNINGLPALLDISDIGNDSMMSMNLGLLLAQVKSIKQDREAHLGNMGLYKDCVAGCEEILNRYDPETAEKNRRNAEMQDIRTQLAESNARNARLEEMLARFLQSHDEAVDKPAPAKSGGAKTKQL